MSKLKSESKAIKKEPELYPLPAIKSKPVAVDFSAPDVSSMGGLSILMNDPRSMDFIRQFSECIIERRVPFLIQHDLFQLCAQRIFQIAAGFEDCDDCDQLRKDSMLKMAVGKLPSNSPLASQPTQSRLDNQITPKELHKIAECFVKNFIASYDKEPYHIIIDADDSNANAYGKQLEIFFNEYYGEYCYMPLFLFEGHSGKLILPLLRPGRVNKRINVCTLIKHIMKRLRRVWPNTIIEFRGDAQFCSHELMEWIDFQPKMSYITGFSGNQKLKKMTAEWVEAAKNEYDETHKPVKRYYTLRYKAGSWKWQHKLVCKIEYNAMGLNVRFVVTNLIINRDFGNDAQFLYEHYCGRGVCELDIKEVKTYLHADRMSCHSFLANHFRLFLYCAAYVVLHNVKSTYFEGTCYESATIQTFRTKVLLSACHIKELKGSIKIQLSENNPAKKEIARALTKLHLQRAV